jgi:hypothetical protein
MPPRCRRHYRQRTSLPAAAPVVWPGLAIICKASSARGGVCAEGMLKRDVRLNYEEPVDAINWTAGAGQPAGVYWLNGSTVIAAHESLAEASLLRRGAVLVATLLFGPDPLERGHNGRSVERLSAGRTWRELHAADAN